MIEPVFLTILMVAALYCMVKNSNELTNIPTWAVECLAILIFYAISMIHFIGTI